MSVEDVLHDMLILARNEGADVVNALDIMGHQPVFEVRIVHLTIIMSVTQVRSRRRPSQLLHLQLGVPSNATRICWISTSLIYTNTLLVIYAVCRDITVARVMSSSSR